jgi:hypothetical protein
MESEKNTAIKIREIEIAKNSLKIGLSMDQISKITGLSVDEIENLKNK